MRNQNLIDAISDYGRSKLSKDSGVPLSSIDQIYYGLRESIGYDYSILLSNTLNISLDIVKPRKKSEEIDRMQALAKGKMND